MSTQDCKVAVIVVVIPNGFIQRQGRTFCRLSLSLKPVCTTGANPPSGVALVDLRRWPEEIWNLSDKLRIQTSIGEELKVTPDLDMAPYIRKSTCLWQRIFADGSRDIDEGFSRLIPGLEVKGTSALPPARSAPAAQLSAAIDAMSQSVLAATVIQRIGHSVLSKSSDEHRVHRDIPSPTEEWWRLFHETKDIASSQLGKQKERAGLRSSAYDPAAQDSPHPTIGASDSSHHLQLVEHLVHKKSSGSDSEKSNRHLMAGFHGLHARYLESLQTSNVADKDEEKFTPEDAAKRKLAGIMSFPTLAKYVGLIIDTDIDVDCLVGADQSQRVHGQVAGFFRYTEGQLSLTNIPWTAYVIRRRSILPPLRTGPNQTASSQWVYEYFGPRKRGEDKEKPGDDGLLKLVQRKDGGKNRFCLQTLDVTNAAIKIYGDSQKSKTNAKTHEDEQFDVLLKSTSRFSELLTRGIVLRDSEAAEEAAKKQEAARAGDPLYAEDLFVGYRIDVSMGTKTPGENISRSACLDRSRWRTLTARTLGYGQDVAKGFYRALEVRSQIFRDDGYVRPMVRQDDNEAHQELFTWTGESLAIPHITETEQQQLKKSKDKTNNRRKKSRPFLLLQPADLTVDIDYDLPSDSSIISRKPAPLREERGYLFGVRYVFLNGCCLDFQEAVSRYINEPDYILGDDNGNPLMYRRRSVIRSPSVLLKTNDRLVTTPDGSRDLFAGETILDVVVRSGAVHNDNAERILIPPRVSFDLAEQSGSFDSHFCSQPPGAFTGKVKARLDKERGVFPVARDGRISYPSEENPDEPHKPSRGSVFVIDPNATPPPVRYYPDPMAQQAGIRFDPEVAFVDRYGKESVTREFWGRRERAENVMPILLHVRKGRKKDSALGWFEPISKTLDQQHKKVTVVLAPGASVCLQLFSVPRGEEMTKHCCFVRSVSLLRDLRHRVPIRMKTAGFSNHHVIKIMSTLDALLVSDTESRAQVSEDLLAYSDLDQVTGCQRIKVTHAVDRPIRPRFFFDTTLRTEEDIVQCTKVGRIRKSELSLYPVTVTIKSGQAQSAAQITSESDKKADELRLIHESWDAYVREQESWDGYAKDKKLIKVTYDDTGKSIKVGTTIECLPVPRLGRRLWQSQEGGLITFFVGEVLIDRLTTGGLKCEANWQEYSPSSVVIRSTDKNTCYTVKAQQRSATLFRLDNIENAGPGDQINGLDKLDLLRKSSDNLRYLAYSFPDGRARKLNIRLVAASRFATYYPTRTITENATKDQTTMWLPATIRPDAPQVDRILPVFHWSNAVHDGGKVATWKRECSLRVYLGTDWFSSGEGEQLALVCWPNNLFSSNSDDKKRQREEEQSRSEIERRGVWDIDPLGLPPESSPTVLGEIQEHPFAKYGQFVTRWGADPIRLSGSLMDPMGADRFDPFSGRRLFKSKVTKNRYNQDLLLRLPEATNSADFNCKQMEDYANEKAQLERPTDPDDKDQINVFLAKVRELKQKHGIDDSKTPPPAGVCPLPVCVLTHDVCFDADDGRWFADIAIDHGDSYFPFVQLGLARYQEHAAGGLELSYPFAAFAQIPPRRQGAVSVLSEHEVMLELSGVGFYRADTGLNDASKLNLPTLDVRLLKAASPSSAPAVLPNWQPATNKKGVVIERTDELPVQRGGEIVWNLKIELPKNGPSARYGLLIEEFEHMGADKLKYEDVSGTRVPTFDTESVRRGPLFSHIVDLGQLALGCNRKE